MGRTLTQRLIATSAVVVTGAAVLTALAAGQRGDAGGTATKPRLSVDLAPFAVAGTGFRPGETVRITVRGTSVASSRSSKASGDGRISMRFPALRLEQCPSYLIITATGDKGSRAQLRRMPPACGIDPGRA